MNSIIIIKIGALGDVVRTSYFAKSLFTKYKCKITWITSNEGYDVLRFNPYITKIIRFGDDFPTKCDLLISLEDDLSYINLTNRIAYDRIIGSYLQDGQLTYTEDSSEWFDMGLISKYGKIHADILKKSNKRSHLKIFENILSLSNVEPIFYNNSVLIEYWKNKRFNNKYVIGLVPYAGSRWPSKAMPHDEYLKLISQIKSYIIDNFQFIPTFWLLCDNSNLSDAYHKFGNLDFVKIINTSDSLHSYSSAIFNCDYIISTDSLGLHLAIANKVSNLSYYAPTSAAEIDTYNTGVKVLSTADDYCSYLPNADNKSLTADRLFKEWEKHFLNIL